MKVKFFENKFGTSFELEPETIDEVSALARIANNTMAGKPQITFYFSGSPSCSIWMRKVTEKSQRNFMSNKRSE